MRKSFIALAAALTLSATGAQAMDRVSIGTGGTGGVFYAVGAGLADLLTVQGDELSANARSHGCINRECAPRFNGPDDHWLLVRLDTLCRIQRGKSRLKTNRMLSQLRPCIPLCCRLPRQRNPEPRASRTSRTCGFPSALRARTLRFWPNACDRP